MLRSLCELLLSLILVLKAIAKPIRSGNPVQRIVAVDSVAVV